MITVGARNCCFTVQTCDWGDRVPCILDLAVIWKATWAAYCAFNILGSSVQFQLSYVQNVTLDGSKQTGAFSAREPRGE